jgi:hypothetical protein
MLSLVGLEAVPQEWKSLVRTQLVRTQLVELVELVELVQKRQLVQLVQVLLERKPLHRQHRSMQVAHPPEQLYRLQHQLQEEFLQQVKEFQCQPCL